MAETFRVDDGRSCRHLSQTTHINSIIRKLSPFPEVEVIDPAAPEYLPIVPSSRLWLPKLGDGDDERFASIFRATWRKIPLGDRRRIVKHWRDDSIQFPIQGFWSPWIALADDWELSDRTFRQPKDLAVCGRNGHSLYFFAPVVDAMPAIHVEELIAHELAHVIQYANGQIVHANTNQPRMFDEIEIIADEIMELWGFEPWDMDQWLDENWTWPKT